MMLKILPAAVVAGFLLLCLSNCSKRNAAEAGAQPCDTTNVKYSTQIVDILQNYCYGCHKGAGAPSGIDFGSYDAFKGWALTPFVIGDITGAPGFTPMPYGKPRLDSCQINTIIAWINQGAQNN